MISSQNQGTVTAVTFLIGLLALGVAVLDLYQLRGVTAQLAQLHQAEVIRRASDQAAVTDRIVKLEAANAELQQKLDAVTAAAAAPAPPPPEKPGR